MATLNGDTLTQQIPQEYSVKELRAKKQALQAQIDLVKLEPDQIMILNDNKQRLEVLRAEKQKIVDLLNSVNLT